MGFSGLDRLRPLREVADRIKTDLPPLTAVSKIKLGWGINFKTGEVVMSEKYKKLISENGKKTSMFYIGEIVGILRAERWHTFYTHVIKEILEIKAINRNLDSKFIYKVASIPLDFEDSKVVINDFDEEDLSKVAISEGAAVLEAGMVGFKSITPEQKEKIKDLLNRTPGNDISDEIKVDFIKLPEPNLEGGFNSLMPKEEDKVNHPSHYKALGAKCSNPDCQKPIECIDVVQYLNFNLGNALKYIWRCEHKGKHIEDLKKAVFYLNKEIEQLEDLSGKEN